MAPRERILAVLHGERPDRPGDFCRLCETIVERRREQFALAARSPALVLQLGENMTSEMIGPERFAGYCVPYYNELASCLHTQGKLLAANSTPLRHGEGQGVRPN